GPHAAQFLLDRLAGGVRHGTIRIVEFDLIIGQGIDQIFLTHILEEVFLSPTLEHAIGQNASSQVPATGGPPGGTTRRWFVPKPLQRLRAWASSAGTANKTPARGRFCAGANRGSASSSSVRHWPRPSRHGQE